MNDDDLLRRVVDLSIEDENRRESNSSLFSTDSSGRKMKELRRVSTFTTQCVLTGIVYDERMKAHKNERYDHPESPARISCIWEALVNGGVVECCKRVEAREATEEEILYVHSKSHYDSMMGTREMPIEKLFHLSLRFNSIFMNPSSIYCALLSAGSVCEVTKHVVIGDLDNGLAIVRPPGHHAECHKPMGFCFFNNVAIAAKMAIEKFGVQRILIVDWDVHHGNATQHMFYEDDRVLYMSLHRYDNAGFYPASEEADYTYCGKGKGEGYNINIAWNYEKMGDAEYMAAFHQVIMPVAYEYNPELVFISCGFDSGEGDPLGGYKVTPNGYAHMTHHLKVLANGKIVVALEGGYNLTTISNSMCAVGEVLLGDTPRAMEVPCIANRSAMMSISDTAQCLSKYWQSLKHWADPVTPTQKSTTPLVIDQAPLTEDSMASEEAEKHDELGRTVPPEELPPHPETPPLGSMPVSSEKIPLNDMQQTIVKALEDEGNVCMFAVTPLAWCEHLSSIVPFPSENIDTSSLCETCSTPRENWVCLTCHHIYCGRYINQHMLAHNEDEGHSVVLSFADLSIWCFACDSYVHNPVLFPFIKIASDDKFKENKPT